MTKDQRRHFIEACDPFVRVTNIINALGTVKDDEPARDHLPGIWPTVGDLRKLREATIALLRAED